MFGGLKSRLIGRQTTAPTEETIRAHVLGEIHQPGPPPFPRPTANQAPRGRYGAEFEGEHQIEVPAIPDLRPPEFEEFPQRNPEPVPPREFEQRYEERGMYELIDRLTVIEAQLATIRAQTETLNERMKTLEMYIRSRMPRTTF